MAADNDAEMLNRLGNQITSLQLKYRALPLDEQMNLFPALKQLLDEYRRYQEKLLMIGIISTADDLKEINKLKAAVDAAADKMQLLAAIGRLISFIALRV